MVFGAAGGGGDGGDGGGYVDGCATPGKDGRGCGHKGGGEGGFGAKALNQNECVVAAGGRGGRGFPGQTRLVELQEITFGDVIEINVGKGGTGGSGGKGYVIGGDGSTGNDGVVVFVPLLTFGDKESE